MIYNCIVKSKRIFARLPHLTISTFPLPLLYLLFNCPEKKKLSNSVQKEFSSKEPVRTRNRRIYRQTLYTISLNAFVQISVTRLGNF